MILLLWVIGWNCLVPNWLVNMITLVIGCSFCISPLLIMDMKDGYSTLRYNNIIISLLFILLKLLITALILLPSLLVFIGRHETGCDCLESTISKVIGLQHLLMYESQLHSATSEFL